MFQTDLTVTRVYDHAYVEERYDRYPTTQAMSYLRLGFVVAFQPTGTLLDVGYGNGAFVKLAQLAGFDAWGIDVHGADYGVRECRDPCRSWDIVTFFDSLEHFADLDSPRRIVSQANIVIITVPKRPVAPLSTLPTWKHYRPGEHLHYFSTESLQRMLAPTHLLIRACELEDVIRGKGIDGLANTSTCVFRRR